MRDSIRTIRLLRSHRVAVSQQGKKWSNPGKMLRARSVKRAILLTMKELINIIVQKTGISEGDAQKAVQVMLGFRKTKMPAPCGHWIHSSAEAGGPRKPVIS